MMVVVMAMKLDGNCDVYDMMGCCSQCGIMGQGTGAWLGWVLEMVRSPDPCGTCGCRVVQLIMVQGGAV